MKKQNRGDGIDERVAKAVRSLTGGGEVEVLTAQEAGDGWLVAVGEVRVRGQVLPFKVPVRVG